MHKLKGNKDWNFILDLFKVRAKKNHNESLFYLFPYSCNWNDFCIAGYKID